jgi:hypothetical protein
MAKVNENKFLRTITRHWLKGSTLTAAAAEMGITVASACSRLRALRERGVGNLSGWGIPRRKKQVAARKSHAPARVAKPPKHAAKAWVVYVGHPTAV